MFGLEALTTYLAATIILFVVAAMSLLRLRSIHMLSADQAGATVSAKVESIVHSLLKLCLTVFLSVACVRVSVDASTAPFVVDGAMGLYGLVLLAASLPCAGLIVAIAPPGDRTRHAWFIVLAGAVAVLAVGYGQVLAAQLSVGGGWALSLTGAAAAILVCGALTVAGTAGHFYCVRTLMQADRTRLALVATDALIAAVPTFIAVYVAASYLQAT